MVQKSQNAVARNCEIIINKNKRIALELSSNK